MLDCIANVEISGTTKCLIHAPDFMSKEFPLLIESGYEAYNVFMSNGVQFRKSVHVLYLKLVLFQEHIVSYRKRYIVIDCIKLVLSNARLCVVSIYNSWID